MVELLALLLLMSLWSLVYFLVIGNRWNSSSCSPVLGVLGCSWWTYHCCCRWMSKWLGFEHWKGYIWCCYALPGRQLVSGHFGDSLMLCVCCATCTSSAWVLSMHTWCVCCLGVCVNQILCIWLGKDQLGRVDHICSFSFVSNLPSGYATWHNSSLVVNMCRDHPLSKMDKEFIKYKIKWRWPCRI
jgi:hypothetical protein